MAKDKRTIDRATWKPSVSKRRRHSGRTSSRTYRVVAVSLYVAEAEWIDDTVEALKRAGGRGASRSAVVQEAILRLQESLREKSGRDLVMDFVESRARRAELQQRQS